ncbi:helix-turn-helix transcriptional regulator [Exilibacterium tricleocarpae]|uniref:Helix-turn-helix transcriptional regulator n=1 Tax=Exilibacterium tricleocarpae TaxID=2591008 RepID=A0A545TLG6_9GAMM|nr:metalloregulator ArsR/SmtB family transcription factor [Exilibacterium tricleocarpae]TQV78048.1 helix-turn-helix transcriptional regulator [Exilibacterium tricleocarpae]
MESLNQTFAALADPTRRGIVAHLIRGEATVSELVQQFDLTQPTISSHLKVLESAGLISRSRKAQTRPCKLEPDGLQALDAWLERFRTVWEGNFERLDALLDDLQDRQPGKEKKP